MTTPQPRRRQRLESALLIVVGIAMLFQAWYFNDQNEDQQACLQENFGALSEALNVRGELSEADSTNTRTVIFEVSNAETRVDLLAAFKRYNDEQTRIQKLRKDTPLPPYPPGACD